MKKVNSNQKFAQQQILWVRTNRDRQIQQVHAPLSKASTADSCGVSCYLTRPAHVGCVRRNEQWLIITRGEIWALTFLLWPREKQMMSLLSGTVTAGCWEMRNGRRGVHEQSEEKSDTHAGRNTAMDAWRKMQIWKSSYMCSLKDSAFLH